VSELPSGWALTMIGEVADVESGFGFPKDMQGKVDGDYPFAKVSDISRAVAVLGGELRTAANFVDEGDLKSLRAKPVPAGSVVFAKIGEALRLNRRATVRVPLVLDNNCMALIPKAMGIESRYLYRFMTTVDLSPFAVATSVPSVRKGDVEGIGLALPPLAEQRRIVAKLDALTARTAHARADLDRIPALAAGYKQAVLAKAFSGELTAEWRTDKSNLMSARAVRAAVRESWLAAQAPISRRRGPIADPETGRKPLELGPLPDTWVQMDLASVTDPARLIQYGILKPGDHIDGGVPYVKVMNIKGGVVELDKIRRTTPEIHEAYRRSSLREGDLLLTIRGTVGRLAEVPAELDGGNITQDSVRIAVLPVVSRRFIYWFMHSPAAQEYFRANQKGVAVRGINVGDVRPMEVPVCSREEQDEIVRRVDHAMVEIDRLTAEAAAARRLLDRLDQAILAKAFRGELVPQDPADEPASVLLDRIRAKRAAAPKARRGRKVAAA